MDFSKFTTKSQQAINEANQLAVANKNQQIENGHILKGMLKVDENVTPHLLNKFGVNMNVFKQTLDGIIQSYPKVTGGQEQLSRNAQATLNNAISLAKEIMASIKKI
jgi:ATP-dependent Clp protease ATP-binding subunit ClpB